MTADSALRAAEILGDARTREVLTADLLGVLCGN